MKKKNMKTYWKETSLNEEQQTEYGQVSDTGTGNVYGEFEVEIRRAYYKNLSVKLLAFYKTKGCQN